MEQVFSTLLKLLLPLRGLDRPERIRGLLADLGYALPEGVLAPASPVDFNALMSVSLELAVRLQAAGTLAEKLAALLEAEDLVRAIWDGAASLQATLISAFQGLPQFLAKTDFQGTFLKRLLDYLIIQYLKKSAPRTHSLLELVGICSATAQSENLANYQAECILLSLHLERIAALIQSPGSVANELYQWDSRFDSNLFLGRLAQAMRVFGLPGNLLPDDDPAYQEDPDQPEPERILFMPLLSGGRWPDSFWQFGLRVEQAKPEGNNKKKGLAIVPYAEGEVAGSAALGERLSFNLVIEAGLEAGLGIFLRPPAELEVQQDLFSNPAGSTQAEFSLELVYADPAKETVLLGSATGSRLAARELSAKAGVEAAGGEGEVTLEIGLPDWSLVIDAGEGDSFINSLLEALPLEVTGSLLAGYALSRGFYIESGAGLSLVIPLNKTIGPFSVEEASLTLALGDASLQIEAALTGGVTLGPLALVIDRIGLSSVLDWAAAGGLLGDFDISFQFKPPDGIGLAIAAGAISGGGFLYIDPDGGYAGVLDLDLLGVGISAFGLVDTGLPGGSWSFFLALYIETPNIPLGFGFTLNGVGGLAGINRTLDVEGLQAAIRSGSLDGVLFPEDPIPAAPQIIDALQSIFPSAEGRYVFGPVIQIGWGTPTLIEAEIGIVISLPDPIVIAVLGSVTSILPTPELDLVALHLEVAGVIDTDAATLAVDASLQGSHMGGFPLSGDMALRSAFGDAPAFLMALGGSHPGFDRPDGFPEIDRLSLAINAGDLIDIRFDCYFAITSNSLQFGASFELSAEVEGFGINGGADFDALVIFSPFSLRTDVGYHVSVRAAGVDLMGVWLDASLSGPNPWRATGTATFTILGIDTHIQLDVTIGAREPGNPPEFEDVLEQLRAAVALPEAWSAAGGGGGVVLAASEAPEGELVVAPDGTLGVSQRVTPLDITIDKSVPWQVLGGYDRFDLKAEAPGLESSGSLKDWFAVSSYMDLDSREQLSAPSFEQLKSGIEFGGGDPTAGAARLGTLNYEQILRDPELDDEGVKSAYLLGAEKRAGLLGGMATAQAGPGFSIAADEAAVQVCAAGYVVADRLSGATLRREDSWSASRASRAGRKAESVVAPAWEVEP